MVGSGDDLLIAVVVLCINLCINLRKIIFTSKIELFCATFLFLTAY